MSEQHPAAAVAAEIMAAKKVLLLTHLRPDGDALGSTFGLAAFLRNQNISADVLIPGPLPRRYQQLFTGALSDVPLNDLDEYDLFIALDCANAARLGCGKDFSLEDLLKRKLVCIDHHGGNSLAAPVAWISPGHASTCQMVMEFIEYLQLPFTASGATFLLTGMMTDTGCFCFSNTDGQCLRMAARALDWGADLEGISNQVFFSKPFSQLKFESELVEKQLHLACNGKFAYACIPDELLAKYDFDLREDEGLIDILRGLENVVIALLAHRRPDGWRISLRSKDSRYPVADVARRFGGGGHALAAGCTIDLPEFEEIARQMTAIFSDILGEKA